MADAQLIKTPKPTSLRVIKLCIVGVSAFSLTACLMPKEVKDNENITKEVINTPGLIHNLKIEGQTDGESYPLHYVSSDNRDKPRDTVVFVHGTPGAWSTFARYFQDPSFTKEFRVVSIDRPGWGESGYPGKTFPTTLQEQAKLIGPILKNVWMHNGKQKVIVSGHSLGASLVPILAADYPQYIRGVVILAGDLEPKLAAARWYNRLLDWTPNFLIPGEWNNSNLEVLALTKSLEKAQPKLAALTLPITILQGTKDTLVNPKSAEYAKILFKHSHLKVEWIQGAGHIIDLQHPDLVKAAIRQMNKESKQKPALTKTQ